MKKQPDFAFLMENPVNLLALGFGSGLSPKAPGTAGSLAALPFWLVINTMPQPYQLALIFLAFLVGILICDSAGKALGVHDHGSIVWDEFVGLWIALYFAPDGWLWMIAAFALFRFFDILKPWPVNVLDKKLRGGFGVMLDDVAAGFMAAAMLVVAAKIV